MLNYIILGIVQGFTEFFPVSSSGHLVILQKLLGVTGQELVVSIVLHLGTALAVVIFFFKDILKLLRDRKALLLVVIVTIITGIIGVLGKDFFEKLFSLPKMVALAFVFSGIVLILTKFTAGKKDAVGVKDAVILGLSQGVAIVPGISRSGMTISTLLFRGVNPQSSFNFSFIVCLPAILGAAILEAKDIGGVCKVNLINLFVGFTFSLITGLVALRILRLVLRKAKFYYFGYYCIVVAVITLLFK